MSPKLIALAKKLTIDTPTIVKTTKQLTETLLSYNWQLLPANYDVPANSQIFGHIIYIAGIEGILYHPSSLKSHVLLFSQEILLEPIRILS